MTEDQMRRALTVYSTALLALMRRHGVQEIAIDRADMEPLEFVDVLDVRRDERGDIVSMRVARSPVETP